MYPNPINGMPLAAVAVRFSQFTTMPIAMEWKKCDTRAHYQTASTEADSSSSSLLAHRSTRLETETGQEQFWCYPIATNLCCESNTRLQSSHFFFFVDCSSPSSVLTSIIIPYNQLCITPTLQLVYWKRSWGMPLWCPWEGKDDESACL